MDANSRESCGGTAPAAPRRPAAGRKGIFLLLPTGLHPWLPIFRPCGPRVRTGGATRVRPADDPTGTVWTALGSGRLENRWRFENRNARRKAGSPLESAPYQRAAPAAPRWPAAARKGIFSGLSGGLHPGLHPRATHLSALRAFDGSCSRPMVIKRGGRRRSPGAEPEACSGLQLCAGLRQRARRQEKGKEAEAKWPVGKPVEV